MSLYVDGPRGPPNHHMGPPPDHQGSDGGSQYWPEDGGYQEGWRRPGQDFHGDHRGHRGGSGGQWENQERFPSHDDDYERYVGGGKKKIMLGIFTYDRCMIRFIDRWRKREHFCPEEKKKVYGVE